MAFRHVITNAVAILKEAGFREADSRRPIEEQSDMGADLCFQVSAEAVTDTLPQHGIPKNTRTATLHVKVAFFQGGGDAGGAAQGGDIKDVDARAVETTNAMVSLLENQLRYDQATGIQRRNWRGTDIVKEDRRVQVREILMAVEYVQDEARRAVAA